MHHHDGRWYEDNMIGGGLESATVGVRFSGKSRYDLNGRIKRVVIYLECPSGYFDWAPATTMRFTFWGRESLA